MMLPRRGNSSASNVNRWRAKQSEVARKRRGGKGVWSKRRGLIIWVCVLLIVVGLLVQLIMVLFSTADAGSSSDEQILDDGLKPSSLRGKGSSDEGPYRAKVEQSGPDPDLDSLMERLRKALAPFQRKYLESIGEPIPQCDSSTITWKDELDGFLGGCPRGGCERFDGLDEAKRACEKDNSCGGLTYSGEKFELRRGHVPESSNMNEVSYVRSSCTRHATAEEVWEAFRLTMEAALDDDENLHLSTRYKTREDKSIYLSISSYRDTTCPFTLRNAFKRAKNPERLFVGIVQQNCEASVCYTGTGWGNTRRWVKQPGKDVDCVKAFCEDNPIICDKQIRILRLHEREAYGPFFGRFLNSHLYRGETMFVQIDAHTEFRQNWDFWLFDQLQKTPSYPYSVISSYPPGGDPKSTRDWAAPSGYSGSTPSALCGMTFEGAGEEHHTVRLTETGRSFARGVDRGVPHHSCFIAAGFFAAHGSVINNVPFDPFMPYLFMGEEISLSIRFWTSGYDIYGPAVNVLRHEYVRKESPKFWESVTMIFSNGGIHNALTDLIIPRVQKLVGWKDTPPKLNSVLSRSDDYSIGPKRTAAQFVRTMNIQIRSLKQTAPKWCLKGLDYPASSSTSVTSHDDDS